MSCEQICDFEFIGCLRCCEPVDVLCSDETASEDLQIIVFEHRIGGIIKHEFNFVNGEKIIFDNNFAQGVEVRLHFEYNDELYAVKFKNEICYGN